MSKSFWRAEAAKVPPPPSGGGKPPEGWGVFQKHPKKVRGVGDVVVTAPTFFAAFLKKSGTKKLL
ncbi:hypothetical protein GT370_06035 [Acidocella sp. MX-AZ03]|uniref:hypothetical protein n=1 Tax=Acidocella sp. MX-AZ03 TaxID=2697363 RepID=UPI0022DE2B76|nr:hypothetical protein [Acidocella sp. MX-AZ03]WBO60364.1 hypothetical protein GT370_06035 [Acidocella sp. MX-AZ03]